MTLAPLPYPSQMHAGVAQASAMSAEEFRRFVAREGDRWLRLAVRLAGEADGPDVLQEALVKAWVAFGEGSAPARGDADSTRWVVRVVVNQAYDAVRARTRRKRWSQLLRFAAPGSSAAVAEARTTLGELERFVNALTPEQRIAWVLKDVEGYSSAEIATLTGASEGAVEQRLVRARAQIQKGLSHET